MAGEVCHKKRTCSEFKYGSVPALNRNKFFIEVQDLTMFYNAVKDRLYIIDGLSAFKGNFYIPPFKYNCNSYYRDGYHGINTDKFPMLAA